MTHHHDVNDVGISAGHGRSPGGSGRLFPDATLATADGGTIALDSYRPRWDLLVLMLGAGPLDPAVDSFLDAVVRARADVEAEDGKLVAVAPAESRWLAGEWHWPFPLTFDDDGNTLHKRVDAIDDAGRPDSALYVTDRYREVFGVMRPGEAEWPTKAREVVQWLTFVNIQCPECNVPEW